MAQNAPEPSTSSGLSMELNDNMEDDLDLDFAKNGDKEEGSESPECSLSSSDSFDSDIDEVLAESTDVLLGGKVITKLDFFFASNSSDGKRNSIEGESSMTYDPTPPSRNQVIGSTPAYLGNLRANPEKMMPLVPIFNSEDLNKPCFLYWNYPRAVLDYEIFEKLMVPIIPNGAVKKLICKQGRDEKLQAGDNVLVNYYIYVEGCPNCVESNKRRHKPHSFVLGRKRGGIPVIDLGTLSMRVKEVAAFLAMPQYGYGKFGTGQSWIPPNKRVLCIIEVLSRLASPLDSSSIINLVPAERRLLRFEEIYEFAVQRQKDATKDMINEKNARAMRKYLQAVTCLQDAIPKDEEQERKKVELFHVLYNYVAICGIATSQMDVVTDFSQKSIALPIPEEQKAYDYFRCGKALYLQQKWHQAKPYADKALELFKGKEVYDDVLKLCNHVDTELGKSTGEEESLAGSSTNLCSPSSSTSSASPPPPDAKDKRKSRRSSSFCAGFLLRRLSESK